MKTKSCISTKEAILAKRKFRSSAAFVYSQIDKEKYDVFPVTISVDQWYHQDQQGNQYPISKEDFSFQREGEKVSFDVAFMMIHGVPGEDGRLQGYFDMIGLPYTSCSALTSALTMNKGYTKAVIQDIPNLHVAQSVLLFNEHRPGLST